jgi:hypothetical protein
MHEVAVNQRRALGHLFDEYQGERVFIDGCLEGQQGFAWVDDAESPQTAILYYGFLYLGGDPRGDGAVELMDLAVQLSDAIVVPSLDWCETICSRFPRRFSWASWTALTSESISPERLRDRMGRIPPGCRVRRIDLPLAKRLFREGVLVFRTYDRSPERFAREGIGYCLFHYGQVASVIHSMGMRNGQLKGNLLTREDLRDYGYGTLVAAHMVTECLERSIEYCWEASSPASLVVAQKLGFVESGPRLICQQQHTVLTIHNFRPHNVEVYADSPVWRQLPATVHAGEVCRSRSFSGLRWVALEDGEPVSEHVVETGTNAWVIAPSG